MSEETSAPVEDAVAADDEAASGDAIFIEFLVEPFVEGSPGPHVQAAVDSFEDRGLPVDLGPFAGLARGDIDAVAEATAEMVRQTLAAGATSLRIHVGPNADTLQVAPLQDALATMIRSVERHIGVNAEGWTRADKQKVVRWLDEQGAFLLRGAVDDIAQVMGVSRITIYNYLNALESPSEPR